MDEADIPPDPDEPGEEYDQEDLCDHCFPGRVGGVKPEYAAA